MAWAAAARSQSSPSPPARASSSERSPSVKARVAGPSSATTGCQGRVSTGRIARTAFDLGVRPGRVGLAGQEHRPQRPVDGDGHPRSPGGSSATLVDQRSSTAMSPRTIQLHARAASRVVRPAAVRLGHRTFQRPDGLALDPPYDDELVELGGRAQPGLPGFEDGEHPRGVGVDEASRSPRPRAVRGVLADRLEHPVPVENRRGRGRRRRGTSRRARSAGRTRPSPHTASTVSASTAPAKTPKRAAEHPLGCGGQSQLQSTTARGLGGRGGARSRAPVTSGRTGRPGAGRSRAGARLRTRAAASSIGRGWPSRRRQLFVDDGLVPRGAEVRPDGGCALGEEAHRVPVVQGAQGVQPLPGTEAELAGWWPARRGRGRW